MRVIQKFQGLINFGFAGFICAGAYGSALAAHHYEINPWYGMLIGGMVSGILGFLTGIVTLHMPNMRAEMKTVVIKRFSLNIYGARNKKAKRSATLIYRESVIPGCSDPRKLMRALLSLQKVLQV